MQWEDPGKWEGHGGRYRGNVRTQVKGLDMVGDVVDYAVEASG